MLVLRRDLSIGKRGWPLEFTQIVIDKKLRPRSGTTSTIDSEFTVSMSPNTEYFHTLTKIKSKITVVLCLVLLGIN